jgi:phage major head subunit gpT-like protein
MELSNFPTMTKWGLGKKKKASKSTLSAVANAVNYCSRGHKDHDFFNSLVTVNYTSAFPEFGKAVAMRPVDILFSILSISTASLKEACYIGKAFLWVHSFHLKTAVISESDIRINLAKEEKSIIVAW